MKQLTNKDGHNIEYQKFYSEYTSKIFESNKDIEKWLKLNIKFKVVVIDEEGETQVLCVDKGGEILNTERSEIKYDDCWNDKIIDLETMCVHNTLKFVDINNLEIIESTLEIVNIKETQTL